VPVPAPQAQSDDRMAERIERVERADRDVPKPLPSQPRPGLRLPYDDPPLVSEQMPEEPAFVDAYRRVGSPRITVFVNRTLEGTIIPATPDDRERRTNDTSRNDNGSGSNYLHRGQYDAAAAQSPDYQAIETMMTEWLACGGNVTVISPTLARQRLSEQQVKELQEGRMNALGEVAQQLGADVLVQVQAHPTKQTQDGLEARVIAEAMNTRGGQSLGRAVVDVSPPLDEPAIKRATRFMTRKLMDDMMNAWSAPPPPNAGGPRDANENDGAAREMRPRDATTGSALPERTIVPPNATPTRALQYPQPVVPPASAPPPSATQP
jgi:hypothetical protein